MLTQAKLLELCVATEGPRRAHLRTEIVLAINRSDYMLNAPTAQLLQVA